MRTAHVAPALLIFAIAFAPAARSEPADARPIIVALAFGADDADREIARELSRIVSTELRRSGLLLLIDPPRELGTRPPGVPAPLVGRPPPPIPHAALSGSVTREPDGRVRIEVRLWDVPRVLHLAGHRYTTQVEQLQLAAQAIADAVHERLTGKPLDRGSGGKN